MRLWTAIVGVAVAWSSGWAAAEEARPAASTSAVGRFGDAPEVSGEITPRATPSDRSGARFGPVSDGANPAQLEAAAVEPKAAAREASELDRSVQSGSVAAFPDWTAPAPPALDPALELLEENPYTVMLASMPAQPVDGRDEPSLENPYSEALRWENPYTEQRLTNPYTEQLDRSSR